MWSGNKPRRVKTTDKWNSLLSVKGWRASTLIGNILVSFPPSSSPLYCANNKHHRSSTPGTPPASTQNSANYLAFLQKVRQLLPSHLSVGVAAPVSFWCLKGFPINQIADTVDYM